MTLIGLAMIVVFGFLTVRNFRTGKAIWGILTGFGLLLGAGTIWVEYERAGNPRVQQAAETSSDPWAKSG